MTKSSTPKGNLGKPLALTLAIAAVFTLIFLCGKSEKLQENGQKYREEGEPVVRTAKLRKQLLTDDQALVTYIRQHLAHPPALTAYNLTHMDRAHVSQYSHQSQNANGIFNAKSNGVFVEVRAWDGEQKSHSLYFERHLSWTGVLIEPEPSLFRTLLSKNRRAYAVHAALATDDGHQEFRPKDTSLTSPPTIPLYSILQALNTTHIDFLSLDVEGKELKVLNTIPWDKVKVRLMCVRADRTPGGPVFLSQFMEEQGYASLGVTENDIWFAFL
ncbi:protein Star-like [Penaeus japonicus]|uniref:protein Star-like n=1 Tax=Penaeus japonicus TaxID=27405 RepID=UPI001C71355F|nr:protein Star-like [Penaeus japonicus]